MTAAEARRAVSGGRATLSIASLTWTRLWRGKAIWVSAGFAVIPILFAGAIATRGRSAQGVAGLLELSTWLLAILPPLHLAASLSEELEDRTSAYLWSRPIPRWSILTGKLLALLPLVFALLAGGALAGGSRLAALGGAMQVPDVLLAFGLGAVAAATCSLGMATLWPKHGMSIAMVYLLFVDLPIGALPVSLQHLSITRHVRAVLHAGASAGAVAGLAIIAAVWAALALYRVRRLE